MSEQIIIKGLLILLGGYMLLPTLLIRIFSIGGVQRAQNGRKEVFLTFDDGPDAVYTPQVLEILRRHGIKAVFFVTGHNAKKHPDIIKTMVQEGHEVGIHGMNHRFSWFIDPLTTLKDIKQANDVVEQITGKRPAFYRAPWGVFNIVNYFNFLINKQHSLLWTFMCWDWTKTCSAQSIAGLVRRRIKNGSIIILHDCSGPVGSSSSAPQAVINALPLIIKDIKQQGYRFGKPNTLNAWCTLGFGKRAAIVLWDFWERCFAKIAGVKPITTKMDSVFKLAVRKYRGKSLTLPDGTVLKTGDLLGELHFDNDLLLKISTQSKNPEKIGISLLRQVKNSLPDLAKTLQTDPAYRQIKAVYGITMIYRGANFLGFGIYDLYPAFFKIITTYYQRWLMIIFHPQGFSHLFKHRSKMIPKMLVISKNDLLRRYSAADNSGSGSPA